MTTATQPTAPAFKSARSAKIAFGKAEKAAKLADDHYNTFSHRCLSEAEGIEQGAARAVCDEKWGAARAIYDAAAEQGFGFYSYEFSHNGTKDLIAANID